jgi:hypothetical protein
LWIDCYSAETVSANSRECEAIGLEGQFADEAAGAFLDYLQIRL